MSAGGCGLVLLAVASCSSSVSSSASSPPAPAPTAPAAVFDTQGSVPVACMTHQRVRPTAAYQAGSGAVSELELPMLAYYTANGDKAYCDARPPTQVDRAWIALYVHDGAERVHVQRYLG